MMLKPALVSFGADQMTHRVSIVLSSLVQMAAAKTIVDVQWKVVVVVQAVSVSLPAVDVPDNC